MHDRRVPRCDVEDLEIAAEEVAIGNELSRRGNRYAYVAERRPLDDGVIVGTDEQPDVHCIRQRCTLELLRGQRVAEARHGHEIDAGAPLELDHGVRVRKTVARFHVLRRPACRAPELERHQAVAVERRGHVRAVRLERWTDRPADLSVRLDALPDEARPRAEDEIPTQALPHEMEVVAVVPHVLAGAGNEVRLGTRIEGRGSSTRLADVRLRVEDADRTETLRLSGVSEDGKA